VDDLISRGNGAVPFGTRLGAYADFNTPRYGKWSYVFGGYVFQQGLEDYSGYLTVGANWNPRESVTLSLNLTPQWSNDWVLWESGNLFGSYSERRLAFDFNVDWIPAPRHELRMRWQWIGIQAEPQQALRSDARGELRSSADQLQSFTVSNLGVQLRYRYEIGPLSDLYFVYGRGGFSLMREEERGVGGLFGSMFDVRDADQLLLKVRYRM
jgi:hypothetical protein